jgi:hypothetical protein
MTTPVLKIVGQHKLTLDIEATENLTRPAQRRGAPTTSYNLLIQT